MVTRTFEPFSSLLRPSPDRVPSRVEGRRGVVSLTGAPRASGLDTACRERQERASHALSFKRHRFPAEVIRYAVWLYFRFTLSFRDVEELLAQRGIEISYETIRCWTIKFGPRIARNLKRRRPAPSPRWHLDEMVCSVGGRRMYLWRAVDDECEVLDLVMQADAIRTPP